MQDTMLTAFYQIVQPLLGTLLLALIWWGISILRQHGYRTTYAEALARALGAGIMAAQDHNLDPFNGEGRKLAIQAGTGYLQATVGTAAKGLGIVAPEQHEDRLVAQMGVMVGQAEAHAQATLDQTALNAAVAALNVNPEVRKLIP